MAVTEDPGVPSGFMIPMDRKLKLLKTIVDCDHFVYRLASFQ
jgi:hypothetical protein